MRIAVIPARGGSKRIPRKNVRAFCGKPMIAWSIEAAASAGCFDRIVVSTDDDGIASAARAHGAEVPFERPAELSGDRTPTIPVIAHAADACGLQDGDLVCALYATAPFVQPEDLRRGLAAMEQEDCAYALSVTTFPFPIQRAVRRDGAGRLEMFEPAQAGARSQDLEEAWHDAGQFYWGTAAAWRAATPIFAPSSFGVSIPRARVQDIDTPEDWARAELMFRLLREGAEGEA